MKIDELDTLAAEKGHYIQRNTNSYYLINSTTNVCVVNPTNTLPSFRNLTDLEQAIRRL